MLENLSNRRCIACYIALIALVVSIGFCFVVYPRLLGGNSGDLDPDRHGDLGRGLFRYHLLSHYPDKHPTIDRAPAYPAGIALLLIVTRGWYPGSVQLAQCIGFSVQCLLVFWISARLWNRKAAMVAAMITAIHPFLIWYLSRMRTEIPTTFLFTLIIAAVIYFVLKPSPRRGIALGLVIGVAALTKGTFLPYIVLVPIMLWLLKDTKVGAGSALAVFVAAFVVVAPWTYRNWRMTGHFIPVHMMAGLNMFVGDMVLDNYRQSPFSSDFLWEVASKKAREIENANVPAKLAGWQREYSRDLIYAKISMDRTRRDPVFFLKKVALNGAMFWFLGESKSKTLVLTALQIPLLLLFCISAYRTIRLKGARTMQGMLIALVVLYYLFHLPMFAYARYSVVLVPTMLAFAVGLLNGSLRHICPEKHAGVCGALVE